MIFRPLALLLSFFILSGCAPQDQQRPRNVILIIADGTGPATYTLGREYRTATGGEPLVFDQILTGAVRTSAADNRVTDSASSATAMASGIKTNNGMIGVAPDAQPRVTVLEEAMARNMATGLISTARITHATPAAFGAHVVSRGQEEEIAAQLLETHPDLMLGGGRAFFLPDSANGARSDEADLIALAEASGYQVVDNAQSLREGQLPLLGLFSSSHMAYELDRKETQEPSLAEMTTHALALLDESPDGFFLMIEAGRIDHAGHGNDIAAHLHDFLAYDDAVRVVLKFAESNGQTLVVATSDHETGGLSLGRDGVYAWYPERIGMIESSIGSMLNQAWTVFEARPPNVAKALQQRFESRGLAVGDDNAAALEQLLATSADPRDDLTRWLVEATARQGGIAWTTSGHTGIDVPLHAFGPGSEHFKRVIQNDELGRRLLDLVR